jgi:hypothetical protein
VQRFCEGCRRYHDLRAFDLDRGDASSVCRAHSREKEKTSRTGARRQQQSKIEALDQQRRGLIAALVKIDQEIAKEERALQVSVPLIPVDAADVFGIDGD